MVHILFDFDSLKILGGLCYTGVAHDVASRTLVNTADIFKNILEIDISGISQLNKFFYCKLVQDHISGHTYYISIGFLWFAVVFFMVIKAAMVNRDVYFSNIFYLYMEDM